MYYKKRISVLILAILVGFTSNAFALEKLFYMLRDDSPDHISDNSTGFASLQTNSKDIDIVTPQAYQIDANGVLWGDIDARILAFTNAHHLKLMPLITNQNFSKKKLHAFLYDTTAQNRALQSILTACQSNHFYGVQFDFEDVGIDDKNALSNFYQLAANVLHKNGFMISATIVPILSTGPNSSDFQRLRFENWAGAFDYKAIAQSCDFVTLMAYDQHGEGTTPGPVASLPWSEDIIKYALTQIPAEKISLGIPTYSDFWYVGATGHNSVDVRLDQISFSDVTGLLKKANAQLQWDKTDKVAFSIFSRDWLNEYIFAEDAASFKAKYNLVKKYNLRGISVWRMGTEDPQIWQVLESASLPQQQTKVKHEHYIKKHKSH